MKKGLDSFDDICLDSNPIFLIEEGRDAIGTRGFMRAQLEDSVFNLITCCWPIKIMALLMG